MLADSTAKATGKHAADCGRTRQSRGLQTVCGALLRRPGWVRFPSIPASGLHTGECDVVDGKIGGIAVHIAARVAAQAAPGEVLVSQTVRDLVAGCGLAFEERGATELRGVPGEWRLYAVTR